MKRNRKEKKTEIERRQTGQHFFIFGSCSTESDPIKVRAAAAFSIE